MGPAGGAGGLGQAEGTGEEVKLRSRDARHVSVFSCHLSPDLWTGRLDVVGAAVSSELGGGWDGSQNRNITQNQVKWARLVYLTKGL